MPADRAAVTPAVESSITQQAAWLNVQQFGGVQKDVGGGLPVRDIRSADAKTKMLPKVFEREDRIDDRMKRSRRHGQGIDTREARDEFGQVFENRLLLAHDLQKAIAFSIAQVFDGEGGFMFGDEIFDQRFVSAPDVIFEIHAMIFGVTQLVEYFEIRAFVQRFAVDDHAVHVENDRLVFLHAAVEVTRL
jgi:hypothetical protein